MKKIFASGTLFYLLILPVFSQDNVDVNCTSQPAQYPGGHAALQDFISRNLYYPKDAFEQRLEGTIHVQFEIDTVGRVFNIDVVKSFYPPMDREARYVIHRMPYWIPARQCGKKISMSFVLPIQFIIAG